MRAAVVNSPGGGFSVEEILIDEPLDNEVLVDVRASGLCHTDLTHSRLATSPVVLGHEVAGVVSAVGSSVTSVVPGDHVVVCGVATCGTCRHCTSGNWVQCMRPQFTQRAPDRPPRLTLNGEPVVQGYSLAGFAEQVLVHERMVVAIPLEIPFVHAALLGCGVLTGAGAVFNAAEVGPGDTIAVIGIGGVGINAVSAASLSGARRIIAIDIKDNALDRAREAGATETVNSATNDAVNTVLTMTGGQGCDAIFDCVGIPAVSEQAMSMLASGGCLYLLGASTLDAKMQIDLASTIRLQKRVQGSRMGSGVFPDDIRLFVDLHLSGRFDGKGWVPREISLDKVDQGYAALADGTISRVVITKF